MVNIEKDIQNATNVFPKLKFTKNKTGFYICVGEIDIFDKKGEYWDSFNIKFTIPKSYPFSFPQVYLVDDRLPIDNNRHINDDRSCCLTVIHEEILRSQKGITIKEFLAEVVTSFFANQLYFEKHKVWANGDYLHRIDGIIQFYKEQIPFISNEQIIFLLTNISMIKNIGRNNNCYCDSGDKFKHCHLPLLGKILRLPKNRINEDIFLIKNLVG